jgi:hypothetical protein
MKSDGKDAQTTKKSKTQIIIIIRENVHVHKTVGKGEGNKARTCRKSSKF